MTLQNILPWIQTAHQQGYGIAALNANTMEQMQAIVLIAQGIRQGLAKVNVATQLNKAFTGAVRDVLTADNNLIDPRKYLEAGRHAQIEAVRERLRFVGAAGKAVCC